jgi:plastocyanin
MLLQQVLRSSISCRTNLAAATVSLMLGGAVALAAGPYVVSQAGRQFQPNEITIKRGEVVQLLNDDADLLHHAYIDSEKMSFDSGDQKPGSRVDIMFKTAGDFVVLCAIHPKMKLRVHVR